MEGKRKLRLKFNRWALRGIERIEMFSIFYRNNLYTEIKNKLSLHIAMR